MKAAYLKPGHVIRVGPYGEKFTVREVRSTHKDGIAIRLRGRAPLYVRWDADFWVEGVDAPPFAAPGPMCRCAITPDISTRAAANHDPGDEHHAPRMRWETVHDDRVRPEHVAHNPAYDLGAVFSSPAYEAAIERVRRDIEARLDRERMGGAIAFITPKRAREWAVRERVFYIADLIPNLQEHAGVLVDHDPGDESADVAPERERRRNLRNAFKFSKRRLF